MTTSRRTSKSTLNAFPIILSVWRNRVLPVAVLQLVRHVLEDPAELDVVAAEHRAGEVRQGEEPGAQRSVAGLELLLLRRRERVDQAV